MDTERNPNSRRRLRRQPMELERAEQAYSALRNRTRDLGKAPLRRDPRVRMGIEAAPHAHQGAPIRQSLHVLPRQAEPGQVARTPRTASHDREIFRTISVQTGAQLIDFMWDGWDSNPGPKP